MLRLVMGAFVSSSDDEGEEEDQQKDQTQGPLGVSEEPVDATEAELRTITLNPVDRQNLKGMLKQLLSEWYKCDRSQSSLDCVPHRLPSPTREQGDGREAADDADGAPGNSEIEPRVCFSASYKSIL